MSTGPETSVPEPDDLQFDHAEFEKAAPASVTCAACKQPIEDQYFEINGTIVCDRCRSVIETQLRGGSKIGRLAKALILGSLAGVVGTVVYASVIYLTRLDIAFVSILVGYLVGRAVRTGSQNRGGLIYQLLAVALTYIAVGATYTSVALVQIYQAEKAQQLAGPAGVAGAVNPGEAPQGSMFKLLISNPLVLLILVFKSPVDEMRDSVISIAIIGFALWQAWKMNVPAKFVVTGPYRVGGIEPAGGLVANA